MNIHATSRAAKPNGKPVPPNGNSAGEVTRALIRSIQADGLGVGDKLPSIRALAERFAVNPSLVRDALMQVQTMGLIRIVSRSGAFVQALDYSPLVGALTETLDHAVMQADSSLFHLLDARQLIEEECVSAAARRGRVEDLLPVRDALEETLKTAEALEVHATTEERLVHYHADIGFHLAIAKLAGNPVLTAMLRSILGLLEPHLVRLPGGEKRKEATRQAHLEVYEALLSGDVEEARRRMNQHVGMAREVLLEELRSLPGSAE